MDFEHVYEQLRLSERRNKELTNMLDEALVELEHLREEVNGMEDEWLPGDDIEAYGQWFILVIEENNHYTVSNNEYCSYRLLDDNHALSERMTLEDLRNNYTNVNLERRQGN